MPTLAKKKVTTTIEMDTYSFLKQRAKQQSQTINQILEEAVKEFQQKLLQQEIYEAATETHHHNEDCIIAESFSAINDWPL